MKEKYNDLLKKYPDFLNSIKDYTPIPINKTNYIPQGSCQIDDTTLIVAYDDKKKNNSVVLLLDKNKKLVKTISIEGKYHSGAIAYDKKTNSIFIPGESGSNNGQSSYVNRYNAKDLLNKNKINATLKIKVDDINNLKSSTNKKSSVAYLTVHNNYLYIGNFSKKSSIIKKYAIKNNGYLIEKETINNPFPYIQGMCIYKYKEKNYYIFSSSFGRRNNSKIFIALLDRNNNLKLHKQIKIPCLAEQINTDNNYLSILFESCAKKYSNAKIIINDICYLDFEKLIK